MAKKSKALIWTEYALARIVLGALGVMPRRAAVAISTAIGRLAFRILGGLRRTGMKNLRLAFPDASDEHRNEMLRGSFESLGRVLGETSQFRKATPESIRRNADLELTPELIEVWDKVKAESRGVVITTGHLGNWELLVFGFAALYQPMAYLARPIDNPLIEDLTVNIRTRFGNQPLNKTNSAMTAIKLLRAGKFVGVLADVNAHPKEGVFVPFFGIEACTTAGPALLATRTNSLLFPIFCVYDHETKRYKLVHGDIIEPAATGDRDADILATTAAFTAQIEKIIRDYPDQWLWIHKRWKTRPKGEPPLY